MTASAKIYKQIGEANSVSRKQSPHVTSVSGTPNEVPVPEQIAQIQGLIKGVMHGQTSVLNSHAVIIGAVALGFAVVIGSIGVVAIDGNNSEVRLTNRIDRLEQNIAQLPNQLLAIATAINSRQPTPQQPTKK